MDVRVLEGGFFGGKEDFGDLNNILTLPPDVH
jgi:hypothetical protein